MSSDDKVKGINTDDGKGNNLLIPFQRFFVLYIDVVGQNSKLEKLQQKFQNPFETKGGFSNEIVEDFTRSFKDVFAMREFFLSFFKDYKKKYFEHQQRNFDVSLDFVFASDGMFIWTKLSDNFFDEIAALKICLDALAMSQIVSFSFDTFFRAGACISYGIEHPDFKGDYYGPGLARAANLEKSAPYPCVLLDSNIIRIIQCYGLVAKKSQNQPVLDTCRQLLAYIEYKKTVATEYDTNPAYIFFPYKRFHQLKSSDSNLINDVITALQKQIQNAELPDKIRKQYEILLNDIHFVTKDTTSID